MKTTLYILALAFTFTSCKDTWPQEYKDQYHRDCMESPTLQGVPESIAKSYCDCVLEKTVAKYPNVEDLLAHMNEVSSDPDIQSCSDNLTPKK
ncbi:MAG: hypothetical protein JNL72_00515 [Flavipsychrobacter sp.]|nr:hypothetical protein [Flavipsychrobacter sp.]